jgi:hypothetical protein
MNILKILRSDKSKKTHRITKNRDGLVFKPVKVIHPGNELNSDMKEMIKVINEAKKEI